MAGIFIDNLFYILFFRVLFTLEKNKQKYLITWNFHDMETYKY